MKAIVSHDVDHITAWEHWNDLLLLKHIVRTFLELGLNHISGREVLGRFENIISNRWNNMDTLMEFDKEHGVPSAFFFGMDNGKGLKYNRQKAFLWIARVMQQGFQTGVHGIAFEMLDDIKKEHDIFASATGLDEFGIRMHYLRKTADTLHHLGKAGYTFDSSISQIGAPYKIDGLWEFPVHIMDGDIMCRNAHWQNQTLKQTKETTMTLIETAHKAEVEYLTIVSHDRYFSESFKTWKQWYIWLIHFLQDNKIPFIGFNDAMAELEQSRYSDVQGDRRTYTADCPTTSVADARHNVMHR